MPASNPISVAAAALRQDYEQGIDPNNASLSNLVFWIRATLGVTKDGSNLVSQVNDQSANGYNLTAAGAQRPTLKAGGFGVDPSLVFNGSSTFLSIASAPNLNFERTDAFSFAGWLKGTGFGAPWAHQRLGTEGYLQNFNGPEPRFYLIGTNSSIMLATGSPVPAGSWFHYACTYDGTQHPSGVKMYLNGSGISVAATTDALNANIANTSAFYVGEREVLSLMWTSDIYEVASWKSVISAANVLKLYNRGKYPLAGNLLNP